MPTVTGATNAIDLTDPLRLFDLSQSFAFGEPTAVSWGADNAGMGLRYAFTGAGFGAFASGFPTIGTNTAVTVTRNGAVNVTITGINLAQVDLFGFIANNNPAGLSQVLFSGADLVTGSSAGDRLFTLSGDDTVNAGAGADTIDAGTGADQIDGGEGEDLWLYNRASSATAISINVAGALSAAGVTLADGTNVRNVERFEITTGAGADTLNLTGATLTGTNRFNAGAGDDLLIADFSAGGPVTLSQATTPLLLGANFLTLFLTSVERFSIIGSTGIDSLVGAAGADTLSGGAGNDFLNGGGGGADLLSGGDGDDSIFSGGAGTTLSGGAGNDQLSGGLGAESLDGGSGNDILSGGDGANILNGGDGDDSITSASAADTIDGGAGNDLFVLSAVGATGVSATIGVSGGAYTISGGGRSVTGVERIQITLADGADAITMTGLLPGQLSLNANAGTDVFTGQFGDSASAIMVNYSSPEFVTLSNAAGASVSIFNFEALNLTGGGGNDILRGVAGNERVAGGAGEDSLFGETGDDTLLGQEGADSLFGGAGNDTLQGGAGNDRLDGGSGVNTVSGEDGDDLVLVFSGSGTLDGGAGLDLLQVFLNDSSNDVVTLGGALQLGGYSAVNFERYDLDLGAGDDTLTVTAAALVGQNAYNGNLGDDLLVADLSSLTTAITLTAFTNGALSFAGASLALSGVERFILTGGSGNDTFEGGAGADSLLGGAGDDQIYAAAIGGIGEMAASTMRGGDGNDRLFATATFAFGDPVANDLLFGDAGDDVLSGFGGQDWLEGGTGNDTINGGSGRDTAVFGATLAQSTIVRNADGSLTVSAPGLGIDTLTGVELLDFADKDVFIDRAVRNFAADQTSDILFRRNDGIVATWDVEGLTIEQARFLPTAGSEWTILQTGNFNGGSFDGVLWQRNDGLVYGWILIGSLVMPNALTGIGAEWDFQAVGDLDGDLVDDVIWRRDDGLVFAWKMKAQQQLVDGTSFLGTGIDSAGVLAGLSNQWAFAGAGDFNSDGRTDLVWRRTDTGVIAIWEMNGFSIVSSTATSQSFGLEWAVAGVGDVNFDGRDDFILRRSSDGMVAVAMMDGAQVLSFANIAAVNPVEWAIQGIGDYNGDGRDDILWRNLTDNVVYVWTLNGATIESAGGLSGVGAEWGII